jgi:cell division protein FtsB
VDHTALVLAIGFWYFGGAIDEKHLYFGSCSGTFRASPMTAATIDTMRAPGETPAIPPRRQPRRFWPQAVLFVSCVVLVNAIVGEKGLMDTLRARRAYAAAAQDLTRLKRENAALRDEARRLRNDPETIEAVARGELGLVKPGEILVTIKDVK